MSTEEPEKELLPLDQMETQQTAAHPASYGQVYEPVTVTTQPACPSYTTTTTYIEQPPNQLILAFMALCLCSCCWPALVFAIMGIIHSVQVDNQWTNKDYVGAQKSSRAAKWWSIAAIVAGVVVLGVYTVFVVLSLAGGTSSSSSQQDNHRY